MNERMFYGEVAGGFDPLVQSILCAVADRSLPYVLESLVSAYEILQESQALQSSGALAPQTFVVNSLDTSRN